MSAFDDENPFADPSVQRAVAGNGTAPAGPAAVGGNVQADLSDYKPFEGQDGGKATLAPASSETVGGGGFAPQGPPPAYTPSGAQQNISSADFQRRQEELERRARDLERREEELKNSRAQGFNAREPNFPPVPKFCPFQPCFYQDINVDIPVEFQRIVKNIYYLWVAQIGLLFANLITALIYLFTDGAGQTFGVALLYWILFTPASYVCWFRPAYKAFKDDSSFNFMLFFFMFFFQSLFSGLYALGVLPGSCGLISAVAQFKAGGAGGIITGILMLVVGFGYAIATLGDAYCLVTIHKLYRSSGMSLAKAQSEFASGVMRNEHVQAAATQAATAAARQTMQSQFGGGGGGGGAPGTGGGGPGPNHEAPRY